MLGLVVWIDRGIEGKTRYFIAKLRKENDEWIVEKDTEIDEEAYYILSENMEKLGFQYVKTVDNLTEYPGENQVDIYRMVVIND